MKPAAKKPKRKRVMQIGKSSPSRDTPKNKVFTAEVETFEEFKNLFVKRAMQKARK